MYDFLRFIDSAQVREYNKGTHFTPAEWAVIIGLSDTRTVEEKIEALRYLADHYDEKCFAEESANMKPGTCDYKVTLPSRDDVIETINVWEDVLRERDSKTDSIYAAMLVEREKYVDVLMSDYRFFHSYWEAFRYLSEKKQEYENGKGHRAGLFGEINCLNMDCGSSGAISGDCFWFDRDLRLVEVFVDRSRLRRKDGSHINLLNVLEYLAYIPLPFKEGDIIKVESLRNKQFYGVMACDWKAPERGSVSMSLPLEFYVEGAGEFDYTDGGSCDVLCCSVCPDEELPQEEQILKLIRAVRRGDLDFQVLLHKFGKKEMEGLLKCQQVKLQSPMCTV